KLVKAGDGRLIVTGTSSQTAGTWINGGTLEVNGVHTGSIRLFPGGTLSGVGTVGDVSTLGGTIRPGSATTPGTLHIANLTADSTSLQIRINGPSSYDQLDVSGSAA